MTAHPIRSRAIVALPALLCAAVVACSTAKPLAVRPAPPPDVVRTLPAGSTVAVQRPTPGVAQIALWFDAGSRDAKPAQLATVSAWWAAQVTGAQARVLPDGTELAVTCATRDGGLARCIERLGKAFALPNPSATDALRLRERLRATRLRASADLARQADELAMAALFGEAAAAMLPLGSELHDGSLEPNAIVRFASEHYAPARAVLIAAGDVDEAQVARSFSAASGRARSAGLPRRAEGAAARSGLKVAHAAESWLALALSTPDQAVAAAIAHGLRQIYTLAEIRVVSMRGAHLVHVRMPAGSAPLKRLQRATFDLRRLEMEGAPGPTARPEESLGQMVRTLGESWAARNSGTSVPSHPWPLGVALLVRDPAAAGEGGGHLQGITDEAARAIQAAERNSLGIVEGKLDAGVARVTAENGVRIEIERRPGDAWMAAAVRFQGGSADDPAARHGRSALLATLLADGCGFASGTTLDARLAALDARLTPLVSARETGVMITAPAAHTEAALDTLLRCAVRPALSSRSLEDARLKLIRSLWGRQEARLHAALGTLLAPLAPGAVAPWGTPQGVAAVHAGELRRLHAELLKGARMDVLVVADRAPEALARFVARRIAQLPAGKPAERSAPPALSAGSVRGESTEKGPLRVVIGLSAPSQESGAGASAFADALAHTLALRAGRVIWRWGDVARERAWIGVALALSEAELGALDAQVRAALRDVGGTQEHTWRAALERIRVERATGLSTSAGYVRAAFAHEAAQELQDDRELELVRKLAQQPPAFFILRPAP